MYTTHPFSQTHVSGSSYMETQIGKNCVNAPEKATEY